MLLNQSKLFVFPRYVKDMNVVVKPKLTKEPIINRQPLEYARFFNFKKASQRVKKFRIVGEAIVVDSGKPRFFKSKKKLQLIEEKHFKPEIHPFRYKF